MKKIFYTMAIAAALFAGYSAYNSQNSNELTDIALANVEALADSNEGSDGKKVCYKVTTPVENETDLGVYVYNCNDCSKRIKVTKSDEQGKCY